MDKNLNLTHLVLSFWAEISELTLAQLANGLQGVSAAKLAS